MQYNLRVSGLNVETKHGGLPDIEVSKFMRAATRLQGSLELRNNNTPEVLVVYFDWFMQQLEDKTAPANFAIWVPIVDINSIWNVPLNDMANNLIQKGACVMRFGFSGLLLPEGLVFGAGKVIARKNKYAAAWRTAIKLHKKWLTVPF